jgi:hypothetical protein
VIARNPRQCWAIRFAVPGLLRRGRAPGGGDLRGRGGPAGRPAASMCLVHGMREAGTCAGLGDPVAGRRAALWSLAPHPPSAGAGRGVGLQGAGGSGAA